LSQRLLLLLSDKNRVCALRFSALQTCLPGSTCCPHRQYKMTAPTAAGPSSVRLTARETAKPARTSDMTKKRPRFSLSAAAAPAHVAGTRRHNGNSDPPPCAGHLGPRSRACSPHTQVGARSIGGDGQQAPVQAVAPYIQVRVLNSAR